MANGIRTDDPRGFNKDIVRSSVYVPESDKHMKKAEGHIDRNVVEITIKMKTTAGKPLLEIVQYNNYWTREEKYFMSLLFWRQNNSKLSQNRYNPLI